MPVYFSALALSPEPGGRVAARPAPENTVNRNTIFGSGWAVYRIAAAKLP
ncbi:MAG: hypothetical protein RIS94_3713 [Pseudomonadota bacterium]|jgi:hypothetical protein